MRNVGGRELRVASWRVEVAHLKPYLPSLVLLGLALAAAWPVWGPGMVNTRGGGDSPFLLWRVHQLASNLRAGVFPVRWMPDAAYGLGYPFFSYYAALPYYIAGLLTVLGVNILTAIKLTQTLGFVLAAFTGYAWFRRLFRTQAAAWLAAVAYTFAPFHLVNVYVRGDSLSEFYAFAFYPLILWSMDRVAEHTADDKALALVLKILGLGLAFGGLLVTHNLSAFIFSPFVLLYAAVRMGQAACSGQSLPATWRARGKRALSIALRLAAGLSLGAALAAWFWLPALLETRYSQPATLGQGYFHYSGHFLWTDLVQTSPAFVYDTTLEHISPFAMGAVQAVAVGLGLLAYTAGRVQSALAGWRPSSVSNQPPPNADLPVLDPGLSGPWRNGFILAGLLLATFIMTPFSEPVWARAPLLPMVQFPWRFLSVQALFAAAATAWLVEYIPAWRNGPACLLAVVLSLAMLWPLRPERLLIGPGDVTVERLQLYELFTANIGTTITYEWLPRDVNPRPYTSEHLMDPTAPPRLFALEGELLGAQETVHRPTQRVWQVETAGDARLILPVLYWPGWQAEVDGGVVAVQPAHSSGRIALDVPPGQHALVLRLGHTPLRLAAELTSVLTALGCGLVVVWGARKEKLQAASTGLRLPGYRLQIPGWESPRFTLYVSRFIAHILLILAFFLLVLARESARPTSAAETMDFVQMPYLHRGGVCFEADDGQACHVLEDYRVEANQVEAGQSVTFDLEWTLADSPLTATLALVGPGAHLPDLQAAVVLARSEVRLEGVSGGAGRSATSQHRLDIPPDLPAGVYLVQVHLTGDEGERRAMSAGGSELGTVYLRSIYVHSERPAGDQPVVAAFGDRIRLHAVRAEQLTPTQLLVELDWSLGRPLAENYGIAVRLYNARGDRWAAMDTQPGYGFWPTSSWLPGQKITDRLALPLPAGLPPRDDYELEIIIYDLARDLAGLGRHLEDGVALTRYTYHSLSEPVLAQLGPSLALAAVDLPATHAQGAPMLSFDTAWLATSTPGSDVAVHWSLLDKRGETAAAYVVRLEAAVWPSGAYVVDVVHMPLPPGLSPGVYHLAATVLDGHGRAILGQETVQVTGRARNYETPSLDHSMGVEWGGWLRLEGYSLAQGDELLRLSLAWRALNTTAADYTVFVHVVRVLDDAMVTQHDAMPLENTYPTSWWVAGEVVSDTITLSLAGAPPGEYRLAVGLYDSATQARLEAYDTQGQRLPADRAVLPEVVSWP